MKRNCCVLLIFLFFVFQLLLSSTSARLLPSKQDEEEVKGQLKIGSPADIKEDVSNLMGSENYECEDEEEECSKRRMVAEAHLDYIYTQNHKKP
ncbi:hypothetical protein JCGZ_23617 [Jatropha curcas]|uniref:Phytosulfokine n=1 Tax=Jatropha curcas TaxID=180498 RepID=A0A067L2M5_JATCU|nr:putative phytosulfokines 6 [Jatropha curcas]KDP42677.1 hypothetical protein JCGZ_23617 [Jatropha curcas]